jgi:deoxyadenosine/deoxycytidine kinase
VKYKFIAIEGNIGAGKTTLASLLSKEFGGNLILEQFRENPFLAKFYEEPDKFAFQLEMTFLLERYKQLSELQNTPLLFSNFTVSDYIFTKCLLFSKINLSKEDYYLFYNFYEVINKKLPKPEIVFYLHADTQQLLDNIKKRGRPYEQSITKHYLNKIERMYMEHFKQTKNLKVVVVNVTNIDWVTNIFLYKRLLYLFDKEYPVGISYVDILESKETTLL